MAPSEVQQRSFSLPSKVFLLGEYAVLAGAPALVATHGPRFVFRDSFEDPHEGRGGFGASSAKFAFDRLRAGQQNIWALYRAETSGSAGVPPSGADLAAQLSGGIVKFNPSTGVCQRFESAVTRTLAANLLIFSATGRAGRKVATHEHLAALRVRDFPTLVPSLEYGLESFARGDATAFGQALSDYADSLWHLDLESPDAHEDRIALSRLSLSGVLGVKGAGALLSDAVVVLMKSGAERDTVIQAAHARGLELIANGLSLHEPGAQ